LRFRWKRFQFYSIRGLGVAIALFFGARELIGGLAPGVFANRALYQLAALVAKLARDSPVYWRDFRAPDALRALALANSSAADCGILAAAFAEERPPAARLKWMVAVEGRRGSLRPGLFPEMEEPATGFQQRDPYKQAGCYCSRGASHRQRAPLMKRTRREFFLRGLSGHDRRRSPGNGFLSPSGFAVKSRPWLRAARGWPGIARN